MAESEMLRRLRPLPEEDDISEWIDASMEKRARTMIDLLLLVDAIGHYPEKEPLPVVFPPRGRERTS